MRNLHKRNLSQLQNLVMSDVLDGLSSQLRQEMVCQSGLSYGTTATTERRHTTSKAVEMPGMQLAQRHIPFVIPLLV